MIDDLQQGREPTIFNSLVTIFFVSLLLFVALLYRQTSLSLLAILVLAVVGGAWAWSMVSIDRIRCYAAIETRRLFPGESVTLATTIENSKWLPVWVKILWTFDKALEPVGKNGSTYWQEAAVLWHQTVQFQQELVALRRGVYQVGPPRLRTGDFLGFFEKEKSAGNVTQLIVYPRLVALKPVVIHRRDLFGLPGAQSPVKDPIYILGTRDYQSANPSRHIHWKASARHLKLQEKIFEPSEQARVLLALDVKSFSKSHQPEYFEHTLEVAASLSVRLDRLGYAIGLTANGILLGGHSALVPLGSGPRQIPTILETLARMQAEPDGSITRAITRIPGSKRGISLIYFCHDQDRSVTDMEHFSRQRQMAVTIVASRGDFNSGPSAASKGANWHWIDELRIDRSRQT